MTKTLVNPSSFTHLFSWKDDAEQWHSRFLTELQKNEVITQLNSYGSHITFPIEGLAIPKKDARVRPLKKDELQRIQENYIRAQQRKNAPDIEREKQKKEEEKIDKWIESNPKEFKGVEKLAKAYIVEYEADRKRRLGTGIMTQKIRALMTRGKERSIASRIMNGESLSEIEKEILEKKDGKSIDKPTPKE